MNERPRDNFDRLTELLNACEQLAPWMSAAIDDTGASERFRAVASRFVEAYVDVRSNRPHVRD